jgi:hypothetical protein
MTWAKWALALVNFGMLATLLLLLDAQGARLISKGDWEYKDLIAIQLSVVSIIVTFVGIIVAVAAIWGFQTLKAMAEEKAIEASKAGSAEYLGSDDFKASVKLEIQSAIDAAAKEAVQNALQPVVLAADAAPEHQAGDQKWVD